MAAPTYWTADMVRALPDDGNRSELVNGELLVSPSPRFWHQRLVGRLHVALENYLRSQGAGEALTAPADISWGEEHVLTQPDVFVLPTFAQKIERWEDLRHLLLVVEVLSPSTARNDRFVKRPECQRRRVPTVWLVEGNERYVEVWTPEATFPVVERERLIWQPDGARQPLTLDLAELFHSGSRGEAQVSCFSLLPSAPLSCLTHRCHPERSEGSTSGGVRAQPSKIPRLRSG